MPTDDEAALVAAVAAGSHRAFNTLIDQHQQAVRAFLRRLTDERADADDLAQDTFLAAWSQAGRFRGGASVRTWLCAIAWRKAKSARRSWFRGLVRDAAWRDRQSLDAGALTDPDDVLSLREALRGLSLEQRAAVALCLGGEFSHAEAAQALGLPLGTVKSHVSRGQKKVLQVLGERR